MSNTLTVAKATQKVSNPVEFTGTIKSIKPIKLENGELVASVDITELPHLMITTKSGVNRKATILRTRKQLLADLNGFLDEDAPMDELIFDADMIGAKRPVTLMVSAHEVGALATVTANSTYAIESGAEIGSEIATSSAGFYTEGFLDIEVSEARKEKRSAEMKLARKLAKAERLED